MERLLTLVAGDDLSPEMRIWAALAPALLVCAWFVVGMGIFLVRSAIWGVPKDPETTKRGGSVLVGEFLRHYFFWLLRPVWAFVVRTGMPPTAITTLSALLGFASGAAAAAGRFALAGWLFIFSGSLDTLDGRLARLRGQATPWGAAIDSSLDRWSDCAVLIGLAWYYRDSWVLLVCLLALMGTSLVPYIRARGEGLGVCVKDGLAQRAERVMYLGVGVALSPVVEALLFPAERRPMHWLAVAALIALAATSNYTAISRLRAVVVALRGKAGHQPRSWKLLLGPGVIAAAVATAADFSIAVTLVYLYGATPGRSTALGCLLGAAINYGLHQLAVLVNHTAPWPKPTRFLFVSSASLLLNVGGVALLLSLPGIDFLFAWGVVRAAVFLLWNFPLASAGYLTEAPREGAAKAEAEDGLALAKKG